MEPEDIGTSVDVFFPAPNYGVGDTITRTDRTFREQDETYLGRVIQMWYIVNLHGEKNGLVSVTVEWSSGFIATYLSHGWEGKPVFVKVC